MKKRINIVLPAVVRADTMGIEDIFLMRGEIIKAVGALSILNMDNDVTVIIN